MKVSYACLYELHPECNMFTCECACHRADDRRATWKRGAT